MRALKMDFEYQQGPVEKEEKQMSLRATPEMGLRRVWSEGRGGEKGEREMK